MKPILSKWNITTQVTWLAAIFMRKKLGFSCPLTRCTWNLYELVIDMIDMLHLPTSSNIYHLHSCTKSNIFAIWIIWRFRWVFVFRPSQARKRTQTRGTEWTASQETLEKALQWDVAKWNHSPIGLDDKWHTFTSPCYVKPVCFSLPCARSLPASKCQQTKRTCDPMLSSLLRLLTVLTVLQ